MDQLEEANQVRTYDCPYCNRGFIKAQALGGHMNLHSKRKSRPKTVASHDHYSSSLLSYNTNDPDCNNNMAYNNFKNYPTVVTVPFSSENNCVAPPPVAYHSFSRLDYSACSSRTPGSYASENLSFRIEPKIVVYGGDQERKEVVDVDVELRLGLNP